MRGQKGQKGKGVAWTAISGKKSPCDGEKSVPVPKLPLADIAASEKVFKLIFLAALKEVSCQLRAAFFTFASRYKRQLPIERKFYLPGDYSKRYEVLYGAADALSMLGRCCLVRKLQIFADIEVLSGGLTEDALLFTMELLADSCRQPKRLVCDGKLERDAIEDIGELNSKLSVGDRDLALCLLQHTYNGKVSMREDRCQRGLFSR